MNDGLDHLFTFIDGNSIRSEKIVAPRYSYWESVFRVFFRKKSNWFALILLAVLLFGAFGLSWFCPYDAYENVTNSATYNLSPARAAEYFGERSLKWILGTGLHGNSIFYGLLSASRTSLVLAAICCVINMTAGVLIGAAWGYSRTLDAIMLVLYNVLANIPYILLISVLVYVIGAGFWSFIFALTVTGWLGIAFFIRTQVLIIRDREYSLASRCLGTPARRVISRNILPYMTSVIVTLLASELPAYIGMEVFLSYIGIGLSASIPSLGRMIEEAQGVFLTYPWEFWPPVAAASVITVILYILGQNLADASDPRTHV